ncbi:hypothetical protein Trydic_g18164 [Trypoxylus dichotomus]
MFTPIVLVQDHSPVHTARLVTQLLQNQPQLEVLRWPCKSSDQPHWKSIRDYVSDVVEVWSANIKDQGSPSYTCKSDFGIFKWDGDMFQFSRIHAPRTAIGP